MVATMNVFTLRIAGVAISFTLTNRRMYNALNRRYHGYAHAVRSATLTLHCTFRTMAPPDGSRRVRVRLGNDSGSIRRQDFACTWSGTCGSVQLTPSIYAFDAFVRVLYATLLPLHQRILLHASAAALGGTALVFMGVSGSGKTTIVSLPHRGRILNDEIIAVGFNRGKTVVWGTPFWGEMGSGPAWVRPVPLGGLFLLHKATDNNVSKLDHQTAMRSLLRCICSFCTDRESIGTLLDLAARLVIEKTPFLLDFRKDASVWRELTGWLSAAPGRQAG